MTTKNEEMIVSYTDGTTPIDFCIEGAGKGGKGSVPIEWPNSLRSIENALSLIALGEGPIQSIDTIYLNDTDVDAYPDVGYECRLGESWQSVIPGFSDVSSASTVQTTLSQGNGIARDVSSATVDAMLVTVQIDSLYWVLDTGDMVGYGVGLTFETRTSPTAGWVVAYGAAIQGKTTTPYAQGFVVQKPAGGTLWGVRVTRQNANDPTVKFSSVTHWSTKTEITYKPLPYNNTVLVGMQADAKSTGGNVPQYSFEVHGLKVMIPDNYDPIAKIYTGTWGGAAASGLYYTTNPAWILLDIITNTRYGLGIDWSQVDTFSFYNAAVYCDQIVQFKDENGVLYWKPRFEYNGVIQTKEDAYQLIQAMASCMRSYVIDLNGLFTCIQDRPTTPTRLFTNANVIDGMFEYNSNQLNERYTNVNVTWNDPTDRFKQRITSVPYPNDYTYASEIAKYPYNSIDIAAMGTTDEGQAYRLGCYYIDNALMTPENIQFKAGIENAYLTPGEVIYVADDHYGGTSMSGRIVSATLGQIVLDRAINVAGSGTIMVYGSTGNVMTANIAGSGWMSTVNLTAALPELPMNNSNFIISIVSLNPRPFRISKISLLSGEALGQIEISGSLYDDNKYARVDGTKTSPPKQYSNPGLYSAAAPINIRTKIVQVSEPSTGLSWVNLQINWDPGDSNAYVYKMKWSCEGRPFIEVNDIGPTEYQIDHASNGMYDIRLYAINSSGAISPEASFQYTYGYSSLPGAPNPGANNPSGLLAMTQFFVKGTGSTQFTGRDLIVSWINPNQVGIGRPVVAKYLLKVYKPDKVTLIKEYSIPLGTTGFDYWYSTNIRDFGKPSRTVYMVIYGVDAQGRLSPPTAGNFQNPAPVAPAFSVLSGTEIVWVDITINPVDLYDFAGFQVCRSTTPNFVKGLGSLEYDGPDSNVQLNVPSYQLYYYSCAAYDSFGNTGLNWSTEQSSMPLTLDAINFSMKDINITVYTPTIYWTAGKIIRNSDEFNISAGSALWSTGTLYLFFNPKLSTTTLQTTTTLGRAVEAGCYPIATYTGGDNTTLKGGDGTAFVSGSSILAGTVGAAQLITGSAVITGTAQIAGAIINTAHIQDGAISNAKIGQSIQSTNYNPGAHTGWNIDKAGNITSYGALNLMDSQGNPIITTGANADVQWQRYIQPGNLLPSPNMGWLHYGTNWVWFGSPQSTDGTELIIPNGSNWAPSQYHLAGQVYAGNWYTFSFRAYPNGGARTVYFDMWPDTSHVFPFVINEHKTYSVTFIMPYWPDMSDAWFRIFGDASGGQIQIYNMQLELGQQATPYRAATKNSINANNKFTTENVGVFMPSACIGQAQIVDASIDTLKLQGNIVTVPTSVYYGGQSDYIYNGWATILDLWVDGQNTWHRQLVSFTTGFMAFQATPNYYGILSARILVNGNVVMDASTGLLFQWGTGHLSGQCTVDVGAWQGCHYQLQVINSGFWSCFARQYCLTSVACKR